MSDQTNSGQSSQDNIPPDEYSQLYQARVPLDEAGDAFSTRDASGRIPIVVIPQRQARIRNELVADSDFDPGGKFRFADNFPQP